MHGKADSKTYTVEGVSVKQFPVQVEWERPAHTKRIQPGIDGSGDLEGFPDMDHTRPQLLYQESPDYKNASPEVKRILSLEFGRSRDYVDVAQHDMVKSVQRHPLDMESLEVLIAIQTINIRRRQEQLAAGPGPIKNAGMSHRLKIRIDHRRVLLRKLRETDYKRFEWLLEKLNIAYKPRPHVWERIERKKHMARLTDLWCTEYQDHLLTNLKTEYEREQPQFLREKAQTLEWIAKEEKELGLEPTTSEEEIKELRKQAAVLEEKLSKVDETSAQDRYFIFEPKVKSVED